MEDFLSRRARVQQLGEGIEGWLNLGFRGRLRRPKLALVDTGSPAESSNRANLGPALAPASPEPPLVPFPRTSQMPYMPNPARLWPLVQAIADHKTSQNTDPPVCSSQAHTERSRACFIFSQASGEKHKNWALVGFPKACCALWIGCHPSLGPT